MRVELKLVPDTQDPYQQSEIRKSRLPFEAAIKAWVNSETSLLALGWTCQRDRRMSALRGSGVTWTYREV